MGNQRLVEGKREADCLSLLEFSRYSVLNGSFCTDKAGSCVS